MIEEILPPGVESADLFVDPPGLVPHPLEESLIARAVDKRKREFVSARHCARLAMGKLGVDPAPILRGERGMPLWPKGVVGSLTHCDGYRGAALAFSMQHRSVGIDAEPHGPLPDGVLDHVSLAAEREWLAATPSSLHLDRLLFCAKEATYKAWFPLTNRWLGFEEAHITFSIDGRGGTFRSELLVPGHTIDGGAPLTSFDGRWLITDRHVFTAITV
ncbi:4'-phosphopantetheinyl transferase Npt [Antrihabitans stalactiti]|uniref:4'-phosphopantetheinyl transferase superfamily protein n=1 Tax=Antrihabitans stalactiti TaxID=2584121 RepID=A0A848KDE6_9NOCA|nr:4'-phosphopantetheinyl transferase Npt [Antrihabitans stalactiti]NMN94180.1 4'-phosphopantetheinyl transferase superfamily protein [Antrihabitans stalactiti]